MAQELSVPTNTPNSTNTTVTANDSANKATNQSIQGNQNTQTLEANEQVETPTEQIVKKNLKKFKLKIDNEEVDDEIDLEDEKELIKRLQLAKVAPKRMEQYAKLSKEYNQIQEEVGTLVEMLMNEPHKVLTDPRLNIDRKKLVEQLMAIDAEEASKTPEQKEIETLQSQLKKFKEDNEKTQKQKQDEEVNKKVADQAKKYEDDMIKAIETEGLPRSKYFIRRMAAFMDTALKNKVNLEMKDIAPLVKEEALKDIRELVGLVSDEKLEDFFGKDLFERKRKERIKKAKETANLGVSTKETGNKPEQAQASKKVNAKDFFGKGMGF